MLTAPALAARAFCTQEAAMAAVQVGSAVSSMNFIFTGSQGARRGLESSSPCLPLLPLQLQAPVSLSVKWDLTRKADLQTK